MQKSIYTHIYTLAFIYVCIWTFDKYAMCLPNLFAEGAVGSKSTCNLQSLVAVVCVYICICVYVYPGKLILHFSFKFITYTASTNRDDVIWQLVSDDLYFQQDGAPPHVSRLSTFHVSFLWNYVEPTTLEELEVNIQHSIASGWRYANGAVVVIWPTFCSYHKWHKIIYITKIK